MPKSKNMNNLKAQFDFEIKIDFFQHIKLLD